MKRSEFCVHEELMRRWNLVMKHMQPSGLNRSCSVQAIFLAAM